MKKVLCFIDELGSGGAERQMVGLAGLLKDYGYIVDVYCYHPNYFYEYYLKEKNVNLIKEITSPKSTFEKFKRSYKVFKSGKYDFVISFAPGAVMASLVLRILMPGFKLIVSDRTNTPNQSFCQKIKYNLYRLATYIVPNSYSQGQILKNGYPFMEKKLHIITNFVDIDRLENAASTKKEPYDKQLRIITIARHHSVKNAPNFLKALKIVISKGIEVRAKWVGNIDNPNFIKTKKICDDLGLNDYIQFIPQQKDVAPYYYDADVLCLPSLLEGFSNVIGEAMSCGLPILCGDIADNHIMVEDGKNGFLFNPHYPEDIADKIICFSKLADEQREKMSIASREIAEKLLSKKVFINKYINLIES